MAPKDPDYAPNAEMFESIDHQTIYDSVQKIEPGVLGATSSVWVAAAKDVIAHTADFLSGVDTLMQDGWHGHAATSAGAGVKTAGIATVTESVVMVEVAKRLDRASEAATAVIGGVPKPIPLNTRVAMAESAFYPTAGQALAIAQKQAEADHREAVRVMNTVYKGAFLTVGNGVPGFTMPSDPTNGPGSDGTNSSDEYIQRLNSSNSNNNNGSSADNSRTAETVANTNQTDPNAVQQGNDPSKTQNANANTTDPTSLTATRNASVDQPGNINPNSPTNDNSLSRSPVATGVNPQTPSFLTSPTGPNLRRQDDKSRDSSNPNLGMGMLGGPAAVVGADSLRQGPSVAANAVAAKSVPSGMMPHGGRAAGDEDKEHKTPSYLVNVHNGTELIGPIDPAAPPVLGDWKEA
jgi:hypothetical protein